MNVPTRHTLRRLCVAFALALPILIYLSFLAGYSVNVPFLDDWTGIVPLLQSASLNHLSFESLWIQHNESRMLFPNILFLWISFLSRFNLQAVMVISLMFLFLTGILIAYWCRGSNLSVVWLIPVAWLLTDLIQWADTLWAFEMAWYLVLFSSTASFLLLASTDNRPLNVYPAIVAAVVASYSSAQGLIVWPVGLVALLSLGRGGPGQRMPVVAWLVSAVVTVGLYFIGFNFGDLGMLGSSSPISFLSHPASSLSFLLNALGGIAIPDGFSNHLLGIAVLLLSLTVIVSFARSDLERRRLTVFPVLMVVFGLLWALFLLVGRSSYGPEKALTSTYTLYYLYQFVGLYLFLVVSRTKKYSGRPANVLSVPLALVLAITCVEVPLGDWYGMEHGYVHMVYMRIVRNAIGFDVWSGSTSELGAGLIPSYVSPGGTTPFVQEVRFLAAQGVTYESPALSPIQGAYLKYTSAYPEYTPALNSLFNLYLARTDLQAAFPPAGPGFVVKLVDWGAGAAATTPEIQGYSVQLRALALALGGKT